MDYIIVENFVDATTMRLVIGENQMRKLNGMDYANKLNHRLALGFKSMT